jgi:hypothetical protein
MSIINRQSVLPCDIHIKDGDEADKKWVCFVGMRDKIPFEIFVGYNNVSFVIPSYVKTGEIICSDDEQEQPFHEYDLRVKDSYGHNIRVESINRVFDKDFHNYSISVSYMLRYMPISTVIRVIKKYYFTDERLIKFKNFIIETLECYNYEPMKEGEVEEVVKIEETTNQQIEGGKDESISQQG